jgi:hypothetical protein
MFTPPPPTKRWRSTTGLLQSRPSAKSSPFSSAASRSRRPSFNFSPPPQDTESAVREACAETLGAISAAMATRHADAAPSTALLDDAGEDAQAAPLGALFQPLLVAMAEQVR